MATAGRPARVMPWMVRSANNVVKSGLQAVASVRADEATSELPITDFRPSASDSVPATNRNTANPAVVTDTERLAVAGLTWNSAANRGRSGCVLYSPAKVTSPPRNRARLARQKRADPRRIWSTPPIIPRNPRGPDTLSRQSWSFRCRVETQSVQSEGVLWQRARLGGAARRCWYGVHARLSV